MTTKTIPNTRTSYTCALREAGFSVYPQWQGTSEMNPDRRDITSYKVLDPDGHFVTMLLLRDLGEDGVEAFFASPNRLIADDIAHLRALWSEAA